MGKPSIIYEVLQKIDSMKRFGQSKHAAKQLEKARCEALGIRWNPAKVPGIFSHTTCDTYKRHMLDFARWARTTHGAKTLAEARHYVGEWLRQDLEAEHAPDTIRVKACAIAKLYDCSARDFGVEMPPRRAEDIWRSRGPRAHDRHVSQERHRDLIDFLRATGLRRKEVSALRWSDVYRDPDTGRVMVHVAQGKGGRPREVPVLDAYQEHVWACRERARLAGRDLVWERIPNRLDVHSYRREYAQALYRELLARGVASGETYRRRDGVVLDRGTAWHVSRALGHSRVDVVARHYH